MRRSSSSSCRARDGERGKLLLSLSTQAARADASSVWRELHERGAASSVVVERCVAGAARALRGVIGCCRALCCALGDRCVAVQHEPRCEY